LMSSKDQHLVDQVGVFTPKRELRDSLSAGEVGFLVAGIKDIHGAPVGDTITLAKTPADKPLPGFATMQPRVFAGLFPTEADDYPDLREALEKLQLNDAALNFEPETSEALGFGFRCGFLGLLHMDIVQERLEREYGVDLVTTAPSVIYEVELTDGEVLTLENPAKLPPPNKISEVREPIIHANILVHRIMLVLSSAYVKKNVAGKSVCTILVARCPFNMNCPCPKWCWTFLTA